MNDRLDIRKECYDCVNMRRILGDAHIRCAKPDYKMKGIKWGVKKGWFFYPLLFDPTWKAVHCENYESNTEKEEDLG